jgi:hypothetical protein
MIHTMNPTTEKKMPSNRRVLEEKAILDPMVCGSMIPPELWRAQSGQALAKDPTRKNVAKVADRRTFEVTDWMESTIFNFNTPFFRNVPAGGRRCP